MSEIVINSSDQHTLQLDNDVDKRKCSDSDVIKDDEAVKEGGDEGRIATHRENRLTSIIDQLRCQNKMKGKSRVQEHRDPVIALSSISLLLSELRLIVITANCARAPDACLLSR
ncbi:unnamed protein product [Euphydryas editha]|uniref:Uncharacterized protein n=1 Tax=Euphydryas editha TaxID=104508 RepID=A0AAU9UD31_EUPED|nr:unnamed protein product [Euphydryas editha]